MSIDYNDPLIKRNLMKKKGSLRFVYVNKEVSSKKFCEHCRALNQVQSKETIIQLVRLYLNLRRIPMKAIRNAKLWMLLKFIKSLNVFQMMILRQWDFQKSGVDQNG